MKTGLGDLFAIFPDLPLSYRKPVQERVQDVRARANTIRRQMEETARARKAHAERLSEMWKRRTGRR